MWVLFANKDNDRLLLEKIRANISLVKSAGLERIEPSNGDPMLISDNGKVSDIQEIVDILFRQAPPARQAPQRQAPPPRQAPPQRQQTRKAAADPRQAPPRNGEKKIIEGEDMPLDNVKKVVNPNNDADLESLLYR
jgi:hypothetical protein